MKIIFSVCTALFLALKLPAQIPPPVVPQGVGVNIHFIEHGERDLDLIAAAGFKFVRMDFSWSETERTEGQYDWTAYDHLTAALDQRGLRAIYILDYVNSHYEPKVESRFALDPHVPEWNTASPRHPESVAAFARWAVAAVQHFRVQPIIWEIYNEPNGDFWKPRPNAVEYTTLALATAKAIRQAEPNATVVGPAMAGFDWPFLTTFLQSGVLQYLDAVSVHPYRGGGSPPETAAPDYQKLRDMIDRHAPSARRGKIPILSGEWGYSTHTGGVSTNAQAEYAVRQQLSNLLNDVPLSIWYDWKNDGLDPRENEQNFGTVNNDLSPKPAYLALQSMMRELAGYRIERRMTQFSSNDFLLLCTNAGGASKLAIWTLDKPHSVHLENLEINLTHMPEYMPFSGAK